MATPPKRPESPTPPVSSGPDMGAWEQSSGSALAHRPSPPAPGLMFASLGLGGLGGLLALTSFFPFMGWLDFFGVPVNAAAALVGLFGLIAGPKRPDGTRAWRGTYRAAIVIGAVGLLAGMI